MILTADTHVVIEMAITTAAEEAGPARAPLRATTALGEMTVATTAMTVAIAAAMMIKMTDVVPDTAVLALQLRRP